MTSNHVATRKDIMMRSSTPGFSRSPGSLWHVLAVTCALSCGCGESSEPPKQAEAGSQSVAAPVGTNETRAASSNAAETIGLESKSVTENLAPPVETTTNSKAEPAARQETASKGVTPESSPKPITPAVELTPTQLAQWAQVEFEPLQLLACRESSAIGFVAGLTHTADGKHFILAGTTVTLWSIDADEPKHVFLEPSGDQTIKSLALSPDGTWFAAGDSDGTLRIWNIADRNELSSKQIYSNDIIQIAISPDAQEIATISYDDEITIWSVDGLQEKNCFKSDTNSLKRIEYMAPGILVAAGETTSRWNVATGKLESQLSRGRYNYTLLRSPDGSRFLFGEKDELKLWNVVDGKIEAVLKGGFATEELMTFSADGRFLATANGAAIRLWDIASGKLVQIIDASGSPITGLSWLPESNLLVVASANGRTRIWGTTKAGESVGLQPMHSAVAMPEGNSKEPANPAQLLATIDLRTFPRLPDCAVQVNDSFNLSCEVGISPSDALLFYRYHLGKAGWQETSSAAAGPGSAQFQKNGFRMTASFYDAGLSKTYVSLNFAGNFDLRGVPKFDAAPTETVFENEDTVMYRTKANVTQIETTLLRKLHEAGWTAYSRLHASQNEIPDSRDLMFLRNGITLNVSIAPFPADPTNNIIQYSKSLTVNSLPIPKDSGFVEFEGSTEPLIVATTAMTLEQARAFYDNELAAQGWLARDYGRSLRDDNNWLAYVRGQQDLTVGLVTQPTGRTLIRVGEDLEKSSWQLEKPQEPVATETAAPGIEAADFPILNESKSAKFDAIDKSIEVSMNTKPLPEVAAVYTNELLSREWQKDGEGITSDDYVLQRFLKNKAEIAIRGRITGGKSIVNIQGDGLLWTKPLPGGKTVVSYATWLRVNHHPATLDLIDAYAAEMKSIAE